MLSAFVALSLLRLLRVLQGWETAGIQSDATKLCWPTRPWDTVLPGLQFVLAGIIGKPEIYHEVPLVRFAFEVVGYL